MPKVIIRVGVGAIVIKDDKLLLGLRNVPDNKGKWELLGGLINTSETLEDAIKRQVREEAGIEVEPGPIVAHYDRYFDNETIRNVGVCFRCRYLSGQPHQTEFGRVSDFQWVGLKEAFELDLTPYTKLQLVKYKEWLELRG